jgi:hypothetical protein
MMMWLATGAELSAQATELPIVGKWRKPYQFGGYQEMTFTQSGDSLQVRRVLVDSTGLSSVTTSSAWYVRGKEWQGPFNDPDGRSVKTAMTTVMKGQLVELTTRFTSPMAGENSVFSIHEYLQVDPRGQLQRRANELLRSGRLADIRTEIWTRVP